MRAVGTGTAKFDLGLLLDWEEEPVAALEYAADLFDAPTIDRMLGHFLVLLEGASADPGRPLGVLPLLPESERFQVLVEWNDRAEPAALRPVHEEVEAWAGRAPDALAIDADGARLTYRELDRRGRGSGPPPAGRRRGTGAGRRRPPPPLAGDGGGRARRAQGGRGLRSARPREPRPSASRPCCARRAWARCSPSARAPARVAGRPGAHSLRGCRGGGSGGTRRSAAGGGARATWPTSIFTSGSTGAPKAVALTHAGLANLVSWHRRAYGVRPEDRAAQVAGVAFDASVWEIWPLPDGWREPAPARRGGAAVAGAPRLLVGRTAHHPRLPPHAAGRAGARPALARGRALALPAHGGRPAAPPARGAPPVPAGEPLRPQRGHGGLHLRSRGRGGSGLASTGDRPADRQRPDPCPRREARAGADRGARRALPRRLRSRPWLPRAAGGHGRALRARSVRR